MKNCLLCNKELEGAVKSATNLKGESFLMCTKCGNVHLVTTDKNGLTSLERTKNGPEAMDQMREAKRLFELAGVGINQFKDDLHSEKKSSNDLNPVDADEEMIKERYRSLPDFVKAMVSEEKMLADYKEFKKMMETRSEADTSMEDAMSSIVKAIRSMLSEDDCDECDCDECQEDDDDCEDCDDCEDKVMCGIINGMLSKKSEPKKETKETLVDSIRKYNYVCTAVKPNGEIASFSAADEKDVADMLKCFEGEGIKVQELYRVDLTPVEVKKETTFTISSK